MSRAYPKLVLSLLYGMEELSGEGADTDQVLHWMVSIAEAFNELDASERSALVATARQMAEEAETAGDLPRADAYRRVADGEDGS